jgi:hypothetical protein
MMSSNTDASTRKTSTEIKKKRNAKAAIENQTYDIEV